MIRDRKYLDYLRTLPCIITGRRGNDHESVDPCHLGGGGVGLKGNDSETLPVGHWCHAEGHQRGEVSFWRENIPDDVLRAALRAYARERYAEWKEDNAS